jgi:hypothetical protein
MSGAKQVSYWVLGVVLLGGLMVAAGAQAADWSVGVWGGGPQYQYVQPYPYQPYYGGYQYGYGPRYGYYPSYRPWNPIVNRQGYSEEGYAPDGTYHSQDTVEDRHSSYYSPGRNQAITPPRTSVQNWNYGPGVNQNRERTSWIGADGRPHSTTIDRTTTSDPWGNTHTDSHVTLKKKQSKAPTSSQQSGVQSQNTQSTNPTSSNTGEAPSAGPSAGPQN